MAESSGAIALTFHETSFDLVEHASGEPWLRYPQIAGALGYAKADKLLDLYSSHAAEFTDSMTALVKLPTAGGVQEVRIFSLRGAHLLGMFARTERAVEFRRWVLDVLEHQPQPAAAAPVPPLVGQTFERVVAERDALRAMLAERVLREEPRLRKVMYYFNLPGLTHRERAILAGWKTHTPYMEALKRLAALGLVDYTPEPRRVEAAMKNLVKRTPKPEGALPKRPATYGNRHDASHMEKMRQGKAAKAAARKTGGAA